MLSFARLVTGTQLPRTPSLFVDHFLETGVEFFHKESARRNRIRIPFDFALFLLLMDPDRFEPTKSLLTHFGHRNYAINCQEYTHFRVHLTHNLDTITYDAFDELCFPILFLMVARIHGRIGTMKTVINQTIEIHKEPIHLSIRMTSSDETRKNSD